MSFSGEDRRRSERMGALIPGRVYFSSARPSLDCRIRDLSEGGACLKGEGVADLPDRFRLEIPARCQIVAVHVRWRKGDQIGVAFERFITAPDASRRWIRAEKRRATSDPPPLRIAAPAIEEAPSALPARRS